MNLRQGSKDRSLCVLHHCMNLRQGSKDRSLCVLHHCMNLRQGSKDRSLCVLSFDKKEEEKEREWPRYDHTQLHAAEVGALKILVPEPLQ